MMRFFDRQKGSMMLRPHTVPAFHRNPSLKTTECVYLGADESEFRCIFLDNVREFHKLRIGILPPPSSFLSSSLT